MAVRTQIYVALTQERSRRAQAVLFDPCYLMQETKAYLTIYLLANQY